MPRGQKRDIDTLIQEVESQINLTQSKLDDLITKKESLISQKHEEELSSVIDLLKSENLSIDDLKQLINNRKKSA